MAGENAREAEEERRESSGETEEERRQAEEKTGKNGGAQRPAQEEREDGRSRIRPAPVQISLPVSRRL